MNEEIREIHYNQIKNLLDKFDVNIDFDDVLKIIDISFKEKTQSEKTYATTVNCRQVVLKFNKNKELIGFELIF